MPPREFDLIRGIARRAGTRDDVVLGIGDDGALLELPDGELLVASTDTLISGVHFPPDTPPAAIGFKALAVNLSDLAAMGASPRWVLLALTLPLAEEDWLDDFLQGFLGLASQHDVSLVGGDTTRGPLAVTVTALGVVPRGQSLDRRGARPGDWVVVSGVPGRAALALDRLRQAGGDFSQLAPHLLDALERPQPRLDLGRFLRGRVHSAIDISDGLLQDLGHLLPEDGGLGAEIWLDQLPVDDDLSAVPAQRRWTLQLTGGDDYELCFTVPDRERGAWEDWAETLKLPLTAIGRIDEGDGIRCLHQGRPWQPPAAAGFEHFSGEGDEP